MAFKIFIGPDAKAQAKEYERQQDIKQLKIMAALALFLIIYIYVYNNYPKYIPSYLKQKKKRR